jgi:hypothetical protein
MPDTSGSRADSLARRFEFDDWPARGHDRGALLVWNATVAGDELPGMTMERVKRTEASTLAETRAVPEAAGDRTAAAPRVHVQSVWRDDRDPGVLVRVDIFECLSEADARDKALWLLGEFESPLVERTRDVGDVAFATRDDGLILFVRANLVYLLRNIERRGRAMRQAAQALDAAAVSTPDARRRTTGTRMPHPPESGSAETVEATLQEAEAGSPERPAPRKFSAPEGDIAVRGGSVVYAGPRSGLERLEVYEWQPE